jgi:hypothetical protein
MEDTLASLRQIGRQLVEEELTNIKISAPEPTNINSSAPPVDNPVDIPKDILVDTPVEKPKAAKADKQATAAKMRAAKQAKKAERAAAANAAAGIPEMPIPPPPKTAEGMDPAEVVRLRQQTIEDLQAAYANGREREVYELLARFGEGAKSFRELKPEAFVPIREAIDNGALT